MTRLILAAAIAAAALIGWFALSVHRLARALDVQPSPAPLPAPEDDSDVVGMPTSWSGSWRYAITGNVVDGVPQPKVIDWDGILTAP